MKNAMVRVGIDRDTLFNSGMDQVCINHLYRALFVYSVGFFNLVKEVIEKTKDMTEGRIKNKRFQSKFGLTVSIWRAFQILLEHTYKTDYNLLINKCKNALILSSC